MSDLDQIQALPEAHKEQLAETVLTALGIDVLRRQGDELIIGCPVSDYHRDQQRNPTAALNVDNLLFHCLAGETLVKTDQGEMPIRSLSGGVHRILDGNGKWVLAPIKEYGQAQLYKVTLSRNGVRKEIYATSEHRWYTSPRGRKGDAKKNLVVTKTLDLKPRMRIPSIWPQQRTSKTDISPLGVMRGFVYGDGTASTHGACALFCGEKDQALLPYFSQLKSYTYDDITKIPTGLPLSWKTKLPDLDEGPSFLLGWLAGYFAADGCVADDGHLSLTSARRETLEYVTAVCDRLGIGTYTLSGRTRTGYKTAPIYTLTLRGKGINPAFFLVPEHRRRFEEAQRVRKYERTNWWVVSVEETDRFEPVYCAEVDTTQSFVLEGNILTGNCLGCGAGGTVLWLIASVHDEIDTIEQAREWLNSEAGLTRAMALPDLLALFDSLYSEKKPAPLPYYSDRMLEGWTQEGIPDYILTERAISAATAREMGICTDPDGWMGPKENRVRTGPRAVIPHWWGGKLVGWQSRRLPGADPTAPKYLSTPGFPRDETLYDYPPRGGRRVVVESPMSVLRHRHHQPLVGTFGSVITERQLDLLTRGCDELIFWLDNDEGGWRTTEGRTSRGRRFPGIPEQASARCNVRIVASPFAADPADLPGDVVDVLIEDAVPWPIWTRPQQLHCHRCWKSAHADGC